MLERIIDLSIRQRWLVLIAVAAMAALGVYNYFRLPIDAVPDITNVQVQINTEAPGYSPMEAEQRVTFVIENVMAGLPKLDYTRSLSRYGLSQVTVIFKDGTDIYFARQLVAERLAEVKAKLPPGLEPAMGPIATGLGEIFMFTVGAQPGAKKPDGNAYDATDLNTVMKWIVRPQLAKVPGVTEVNSVGGNERQYLVAPFPGKLLAYGLSLRDLMQALADNNANVGAGYIERNGAQYLIRSPGQVHGLILGGGWALEREFLQQQRQLGLRLGVPGEHELPTVGGGYVHIEHLHGGKLLDHSARGQSRRQGVQSSAQRDVQAIGEEGIPELVGSDRAALPCRNPPLYAVKESRVSPHQWPAPHALRRRALPIGVCERVAEPISARIRMSLDDGNALGHSNCRRDACAPRGLTSGIEAPASVRVQGVIATLSTPSR